MKVTAVELTDMVDSDNKEEQDTATAVDNICYEGVHSRLIYCITYHSLKFFIYVNIKQHHKRLVTNTPDAKTYSYDPSLCALRDTPAIYENYSLHKVCT